MTSRLRRNIPLRKKIQRSVENNKAMILKHKRSRKRVYDPFVLKDAKVPLGKSGLKVVDWKTMEFLKVEIEQARKEAAASKE